MKVKTSEPNISKKNASKKPTADEDADMEVEAEGNEEEVARKHGPQNSTQGRKRQPKLPN